MSEKIKELRELISHKAASEQFIHYKWFAEWHLQLVEDIATQLLTHYPDANEDLVRVMAWMHDYGKIVDFDNQYDHKYINEGKQILIDLGFDEAFAQTVTDNIRILDSKTNIDKANIETQIVSSADGCSHLVGPFLKLYWHENPDKSYKDLMSENTRKLTLDWDKKVTLKKAREAYQTLHDTELIQAQGLLPSL